MSTEPRRDKRRTTVTIADVAASIGVATSTVSRALTQPGRVSEQTRERVIAAARDLGYVANPQARSLTSGTTRTLALFIPDVTNPFFFDLIRGTQSQASARGYRQILVDTQESRFRESANLSELQSSVDGYILSASRLSDDELAAAARRSALVAINRDAPGVPAVVIDTASAMGHAIEHLVSLGHTSVAYVGGPTESWGSEQRWQGVHAASERLGIESRVVGAFTPTVQSGAAAADAVANSGATACLFYNDLLAIGAIRRFTERGIRVPEDMSVVGCDDIFGADFYNPPLTTITNPIEQAGRVAVDMLLASLDDRGDPDDTPRHAIPAHLTIRRSTGPAREI